MAKFNTPVTNKTVNREGHVAYAMKDKEKLVTQICRKAHLTEPS